MKVPRKVVDALRPLSGDGCDWVAGGGAERAMKWLRSNGLVRPWGTSYPSMKPMGYYVLPEAFDLAGLPRPTRTPSLSENESPEPQS